MAKLECVRCGQKGSVDRFHMFFCDRCAQMHQSAAFRENPPLFRLLVGEGRCEFCDNPLPLAYYQWLLCRVCGIVVGSYRKGQVSARFALAELNQNVGLPLGLNFREIDSVIIQGRDRARKPGVPRISKLDIEATLDGAPLFLAELKTGPGAIGEMTDFQLDCGDCDDITNAVARTGLPAILLHCQIELVAEPPTLRIVGRQLWWADLWDFAAHFKKIAARRGEARKLAASYRPSCFRELATLRDAIAGGYLDEIRARLRTEGPPRLYPAKA